MSEGLDAMLDSMQNKIGTMQMALRVAYELAAYGPGTAPQIAERLTEHDDDHYPVKAKWVDEALGELDSWSLLEFSGLEDADPIALVGSQRSFQQ